MDKKTLCEAMYALPGEVVVRRPKKKLYAVVTIVAAVLMLAATSLMSDSLSINLHSSAILVALSALGIGIIWLLVLLFDKQGVPVLKRTGRELRYEERYFSVGERNEVLRMVDNRLLKRLLATKSGQISGIAVAIYYADDKEFGAMQAYEYIDFEYRPITLVRTVGTQEN